MHGGGRRAGFRRIGPRSDGRGEVSGLFGGSDTAFGSLVVASLVGSGVAAVLSGGGGGRIDWWWKLVVEGSGGGIGSFVAHVFRRSWLSRVFFIASEENIKVVKVLMLKKFEVTLYT